MSSEDDSVKVAYIIMVAFPIIFGVLFYLAIYGGWLVFLEVVVGILLGLMIGIRLAKTKGHQNEG